MLHRIDLQNNVVQSDTIQYFRHVIAYYYPPPPPYFTSPTKEEHERLGAAQQRSFLDSMIGGVA